MKNYFLLALFILIGCQTAKKPEEVRIPPSPPSGRPPTEEQGMGIMGMEKAKPLPPQYPADWIVLQHNFLRIVFDKTLTLPRLVTYAQSDENLKKRWIKRKDDDEFTQDRCLLKNSPKLALTYGDFEDKIKFNAGHMAPAEDFTFDDDAFEEVFYMSNMVPQKAKFNQVTWRDLEAKVLNFACGERKITVLTGPILKEPYRRYGKKNIVRPARLFKIVVDETPPRKVVAFIYNEDDPSKDIQAHVLTIAEIEAETGIDIKREITRPSDFDFKIMGDTAKWTSKVCPQQEVQTLDKVVHDRRHAREKELAKTLPPGSVVQIMRSEPECWKNLKQGDY